ncbi:MAG: agmatine deiminase family protein [Methanothrix sp.]|nr:agmatine deiminase family protein [Methanothrix sp.]
MQKDRVVVGLVQMAASEEGDLNLRRGIEMVRDAARRGAEIVCLPELFRARYFPQREKNDAFLQAETIPGPSTEALSALAKELEIAIVAPVFERDESSFYNSVAVIDADGSLLDTYRKVHVPHDPLFYERSYFTPGDEIRVYSTRYGRFSALICYDQWFPEAARIAALRGAELIFYPTAIGWIRGNERPEEGDWHDAWRTIQRGHAIANSVYVAAVNRVGREDDLTFWGGSFVCDPFGRVLAEGGEDEEVLVVELDLSRNEMIREGWGFFRNRRPDVYWPLIEMVREPKTTVGIGEVRCPEETPDGLGYQMPAEWERHEALWLAWPYDKETFPEIEGVERAYLSIIGAIRRSETVNLLVRDEMMLDRVVGLLRSGGMDLKGIRFHLISYADVWFRDYGPTFVVNRERKSLAMVKWVFNAWGGKYPEMMGDARIPCIINDDLRLECFMPGIVLEGGSIDVNGRGTVLTTEQCLLNSNRNPHLDRDDLEVYLKEYLGARKVIWLKRGIEGDDTDGHVDDIARFVGPRTVVCAYEEDREDGNYEALAENFEILCRETDQDGSSLEVVRLPMPGRLEYAGRRLPASYANFYIGNDVVLVPTFRHKNDSAALRILKELLPGRRVVGIDCTEMIQGLGSIHCITQQQPDVR